MKRFVIGLTGAFGSGKTTASEYLISKGYKRVVLSTVLEEEAEKRNLPITRKVLQDIGNELRVKNGSGILAKMAIAKVKDEEKVVFDGLRNLGELDVVKKNGGIVVAIVVDKKNRYERLKNLKRREKLTPKLFNDLDLRDLGVNEKITGLQTAFCIALADVFIDSNSSINDFKGKIDKFLHEYER